MNAGLGITIEHHAGLADRVDDVLEHPWHAWFHLGTVKRYSSAPSKRGKKPLHLGPGRGLVARRGLAGEDCHLRRGAFATANRQRLVPEVQDVDLDAWIGPPVGVKELVRDRARPRLLITRRRDHGSGLVITCSFEIAWLGSSQLEDALYVRLRPIHSVAIGAA